MRAMKALAAGQLATVPTLDELAAEPERIRELAPDTARTLLVRLATLQPLLLAQTMMPIPAERRDDADDLLLVPAAAKRLGIEASYLYELIRQGRVQAVHLGPKYVRLHPDVVAEIQRNGLDSLLSHPYSSGHDERRPRGAAEATGTDAGGIRRATRRPREHAGALRARRAVNPGAGGPAGDDSGG